MDAFESIWSIKWRRKIRRWWIIWESFSKWNRHPMLDSKPAKPRKRRWSRIMWIKIHQTNFRFSFTTFLFRLSSKLKNRHPESQFYEKQMEIFTAQFLEYSESHLESFKDSDLGNLIFYFCVLLIKFHESLRDRFKQENLYELKQQSKWHCMMFISYADRICEMLLGVIVLSQTQNVRKSNKDLFERLEVF